MDPVQTRLEALEQQMHTVTHQLHWWLGMASNVTALLGAFVIVCWSVAPVGADGIQCGDVLGPGGRFALERDLVCGDRAFAVRDGAILDLNGHIVSCRPFGFRCIVLTGTGAQLLNGAVQGGDHENIVLEGTGGHTVRNVTSTHVDHNIVVRSNHNQLINVLAESFTNPAFSIIGNYNRLTDSSAHCVNQGFSDGCIDVRGNENRLIQNFATATGSPDSRQNGFVISGHHNVLRGNRAIRNDGRGMVVSGTGNRLSRNTALENGLDLQDTHGDCDHNTWGPNIFQTSDPACIGQTAEEAVVD